METEKKMLLELFTALSAILFFLFPKWPDKCQRKAVVLMHTPGPTRNFIWLGIASIFGVLLWSDSVTLKIERKEKADAELSGSPAYQAQALVRHHLQVIYDLLQSKADKLSKNPNDRVFLEDVQMQFFRFKFGQAVEDAANEGLDTAAAQKYEYANVGSVQPGDRVKFYNDAKFEVQKLVNQLPKPPAK